MELGFEHLNSGLCACKADALLLEPSLQSIFLDIESLTNYLPRLALNCSLSLPPKQLRFAPISFDFHDSSGNFVVTSSFI
jgi:hypothetical protein